MVLNEVRRRPTEQRHARDHGEDGREVAGVERPIERPVVRVQHAERVAHLEQDPAARDERGDVLATIHVVVVPRDGHDYARSAAEAHGRRQATPAHEEEEQNCNGIKNKGQTN